MEQLKTWLGERGLGADIAAVLAALLAAAAVVLLALAANLIAKQLIVRVLHPFFRRTETTWDDAFLQRKVLTRLSHLAPALVIHTAAPLAFGDYPTVVAVVKALAVAYFIAVGIAVVDAFLSAVLDVYETFEISQRVYLKGFIQVIKILVFIGGAVFILAQLIGKSPVVFFSGLGAFTAVLLLIFKDAILGFVAGIQLMSNQMVRRGDWIEMPRYGISGDVIDVSLTTIKVQNFDKTISTVPPYALVTDSFKNWRGMSEAGGRRIMRSISIDMGTIRFLNEKDLERLKKIRHIKTYLEKKIEEISEHNRSLEVDETFLVNGRHLTNIGTFRAYVDAYLRNHPRIRQDLTFLVRQLPPGATGLPIEIYVFTNDPTWANYEAIQADIFDHLLAVIPLFDLRVFQAPSGSDVKTLAPAGEPRDAGRRPRELTN